MTTILTRLQRFILETHFWLGLSAAVCTWGTFVLLSQPVSFRYLAFVLCSTIWVYTYHGYRNGKENESGTRSASTTRLLVKAVIGIGFVTSVILFFTLDAWVQLLMIIPALLALLYMFPVYRGRRLKDFPFIKIIAIVIAWAVITYGIPVFKIPLWWSESGYSFLFVDRLFFFFALAIPFDIRDMEYDQHHAIKTIPNTIGFENSQYLALFSIFLSGGFMAMGFDHLLLPDTIRMSILTVYVLIGVVIIQLKHRPTKGYYSWLIDGFLLLYGLSILLLSDNL